MLNRNTFTIGARLTIGAGLLTPPKRPTEGLQRSTRVSRPRRNGRPKVSSSVRPKRPEFGAGLLTPPKRPTEGLLFYSAKSITPGDSQVRM